MSRRESRILTAQVKAAMAKAIGERSYVALVLEPSPDGTASIVVMGNVTSESSDSIIAAAAYALTKRGAIPRQEIQDADTLETDLTKSARRN
jgi:hypothetical protein